MKEGKKGKKKEKKGNVNNILFTSNKKKNSLSEKIRLQNGIFS